MPHQGPFDTVPIWSRASAASPKALKEARRMRPAPSSSRQKNGPRQRVRPLWRGPSLVVVAATDEP